MKTPPRIVVLVSGNGSNLQALIDACEDGTISGRIVTVISNRSKAFGLTRAERAGIPQVVAPYRPFKGQEDGRRAYDAALAEQVAALEPDVIVLAGWMRILTGRFLSVFPGRVINLHPALPGEYPGLHAIDRAWEDARQGLRDHTGIMVHEVIEEVDAGPVLGTTKVPIEPGMTLEALEQAVHRAEHRLLVEVVAQRCLSLKAP